jgi:hypothetical protein
MEGRTGSFFDKKIIYKTDNQLIANPYYTFYFLHTNGDQSSSLDTMGALARFEFELKLNESALGIL